MASNKQLKSVLEAYSRLGGSLQDVGHLLNHATRRFNDQLDDILTILEDDDHKRTCFIVDNIDWTELGGMPSAQPDGVVLSWCRQNEGLPAKGASGKFMWPLRREEKTQQGLCIEFIYLSSST